MTDSIIPFGDSSSITTVELLGEVNRLRVAAGEKPHTNNKFLRKVHDECPELDEEVVETFSITSDNKYAPDRDIKGYTLTIKRRLFFVRATTQTRPQLGRTGTCCAQVFPRLLR